MKRFEFRLTGLTDRRLRRYRKLPTESYFGAQLAVVVVVAAGVFTAIRHNELFEPAPAAINLIGQSRSPLTGECIGTIEASAIRGYEGVPQYLTIRIEPPYDSIIAKVVIDETNCQQCEVTRIDDGTFISPGEFLGKGPFHLDFVALDSDGVERCRGRSVELEALGPRP